MKKVCCVLGLLSVLVARGDANFCNRILDAGSTKVVPFEDTVSPDGDFAIGWTAFTLSKDAAPIDWSKWNSGNIEDFFVSDGSIDTGGKYYGMTDGVIDLKHKTFLALPSEAPAYPRKNREYLFAIWGPVVNGVRHALVENDSRFYTENVWLLTIDSHGMRATDLATKFTQAVAPILKAKRPVGARDYGTFFHNFDEGKPAFSMIGDTASLPFISDIPKSLLETSSVKGTITVRLSDGAIVKVVSDTAVDDPFANNAALGNADRSLNEVYAKLAKSLSVLDRDALKKEQIGWIEQRDHAAEAAMVSVEDDQSLAPADNRDKVLLEETRKRLADLQGRLQ